jgi:hypothetical protein
MDDVYLLNNPFTFQSMEKHAAYCAMIRLGSRCPRPGSCPYKTAAGQPPFPLHRSEVQPAVRPGARSPSRSATRST